MTEKAQRLTKETLVPLSLFMAGLSIMATLAWHAGSAWTANRNQVADHEKRIAVVEQRVMQPLDRIEALLRDK